MSKLSMIQEALEKNPEVIIVHTEDLNYLPETDGSFCQIRDYWVAPKNGLYTAEELQDFMMGLVPNLKSTQLRDFTQPHKYGALKFGILYFDEKVGEEKRITKRILTLTDKELLNGAGFVNGKRTIDKEVTKEYIRRIYVYPFPDEAFARDVLDIKLIFSRYQAKPRVLKRYKRNLVQRLGR